MTSKVYRSAQGKMVDLGTIKLQNAHVRAVGNMGVNARGDRLDSNNQVVETKSRQVQKQNDRTAVESLTVHTSGARARRANQATIDPAPVDAPVDAPVITPVDAPVALGNNPVVEQSAVEAAPKAPSNIPAGGLAAAIARSREVKQELEKTPRQQQQSQGVRKI